MRVTSITMDSYTPQDTGVCAEVSIVLDGNICIHHLKVVNGKEGTFVAYPSIKGRRENGKKRYSDIIHPTNIDTRKSIEEHILQYYYSYNN